MFLIGTHCLYMSTNAVGYIENYSLDPSSEGHTC